MAVRTDADTVKAILAPGNDYDLVRAPSLVPAITAGSALTDDIEEYAVANSIVISVERLTLIEGWLAAHAFKLSDKPFASKNTGRASASFDGKTGMRLEATLYGQQAVLLDKTGYLATLATTGSLVVGGEWLGLPTSQQGSYEDR